MPVLLSLLARLVPLFVRTDPPPPAAPVAPPPEHQGLVLSPIRLRVLEVAQKCVGLKASNRTTRAEFERMLGPAPKGGWDLDRPFKCWKDANGTWHTQGVSTCALFAYQVLVEAGLLPQRPDPYVPGSIEQLLETAARRRGAWRYTGEPKPGDIVNVASPSHWFVLTASDDKVASSIDAGQVDEKGLQCIKACTRQRMPSIPGLPVSSGSVGGRGICGYIDVDCLVPTA